MAIYDFSLVSMYALSGVDSAMCQRANIMSARGYEVALIFPTPPEPRDLTLYKGLGIGYDKMLGVHMSFTDVDDFTPKVSTEILLFELENSLKCTEKQVFENHILVKANHMSAALIFDDTKSYVHAVEYYKNSDLIQKDYYADVKYMSVFYGREEEQGNSRQVVKRRIFYNRDHSIAFIQNYYKGQEQNIFSNGLTYNETQLFRAFVDKLNLTKKDLVFIERPSWVFPTNVLFEYSEKTNIVAVLHSEHFFEKGCSTTGWYLNREYWYWCKYSKYIHTMIVGTEEQRDGLRNMLECYGWKIPEIQAIPAANLNKMYFPIITRKKKSLICVSRLDERKKIEWTILSVIKAHDYDSDISLDIYGGGADWKYVAYLNKLIADNKASEYIKLKGYMDVKEIYQNYEGYISTSLWETFGITLMEAVSSGLALIGLDVRYGNRLFIEDGENGFLVPYNPEHMFEKCPMEIDELAQKIVEVFSDDKRLEAFRKRSYQIAEKYMSHHVNQKWYDLIEEKIGKPERKM